MLTELKVVQNTFSIDKMPVQATLLLEDGTSFEGTSFGYSEARAGEVVFSTGRFWKHKKIPPLPNVKGRECRGLFCYA